MQSRHDEKGGDGMSISASSVTLAAWSSSPDGTGLRRPQEYARGAKYRLTPPGCCSSGRLSVRAQGGAGRHGVAVGVPVTSADGGSSLTPVRVAVTRTMYSVPLPRLGIV